VIVVEGEMGVGKPEEVVYRYALSKLGGEGGGRLDGGGQPRVGRAGASAPGLRGIWVDAPGQGLPKSCSVAPHRVIRAFPELLE